MSTPEEIARKVMNLEPHERLRLAAELLLERRPHLALAIIRKVDEELSAVLRVDRE
jgi:hypothetical protein